MARSSGRVIVAIVLALGIGVGALGSWWMVHARPVPGDFVDAIATDDGGAVVIRRERGADRDFVEVYDKDRLRWRGLIPRYAGAVGTPAVAATRKVVTVRVARGGHSEVFAFDTVHGAKLASFDLTEDAPADPHAYTLPGLATVWAGAWSVEVVARPGGGARLYAMALDERRLAWSVDVATAPTDVWFGTGGQVRARIGDQVQAWNLGTGKPEAPTSTDHPPTAPGLHVTADGFAFAAGDHTDVTVPGDAVRPQPYHVAGGRGWIVEPDKLSVVDGPLGITRVIRR